MLKATYPQKYRYGMQVIEMLIAQILVLNNVFNIYTHTVHSKCVVNKVNILYYPS